jgi:integrase
LARNGELLRRHRGSAGVGEQPDFAGHGSALRVRDDQRVAASHHNKRDHGSRRRSGSSGERDQRRDGESLYEPTWWAQSVSNPQPFPVSNITTLKKSDTLAPRVRKQKPSSGEKPSQKGIAYVSKAEVERFFRAIPAENLRDRLLFDLIYRFGLRRREAALIELDDISLENETIWIRRLKRGISAAYRFHPRSLALLRAYLPLRDWGGNRFLFQSPQRRGKALSTSFIYQRFRAYATTADLPENRRHVHVFRHSIAVHFMNEGLDSSDVKDWLGHRSLTSTMIYAQVTNKRRDQTYLRLMQSQEIAET